LVLKGYDNTDAGSVWIDQDTGLIGEMISTHTSRPANPEKTKITRDDIVMQLYNIEIDCEIPEETFVFSPHPRDRLVEQRSVSDDTSPAVLEPSLHLVRGIDDEPGAEKIESVSGFKIGSSIDDMVWYDLDDDGRSERIVSSNSVLAIISPDGSLRERIYLQGSAASWALSEITPVEIGNQLHWFASFSNGACALYSRAGEERWHFYPETADDARMGIAVDDLNGDDQPEMIVWVNAREEEPKDRTSWYSYLFILDALGQRLVQKRFAKWIDSVDLIEPEDPNDHPRLLLLLDSEPAFHSYASLYDLDLRRSQTSRGESRAFD
jgi:hypothetical protein